MGLCFVFRARSRLSVSCRFLFRLCLLCNRFSVTRLCGCVLLPVFSSCIARECVFEQQTEMSPCHVGAFCNLFCEEFFGCSALFTCLSASVPSLSACFLAVMLSLAAFSPCVVLSSFVTWVIVRVT